MRTSTPPRPSAARGANPDHQRPFRPRREMAAKGTPCQDPPSRPVKPPAPWSSCASSPAKNPPGCAQLNAPARTSAPGSPAWPMLRPPASSSQRHRLLHQLHLDGDQCRAHRLHLLARECRAWLSPPHTIVSSLRHFMRRADGARRPLQRRRTWVGVGFPLHGPPFALPWDRLNRELIPTISRRTTRPDPRRVLRLSLGVAGMSGLSVRQLWAQPNADSPQPARGGRSGSDLRSWPDMGPTAERLA